MPDSEPLYLAPVFSTYLESLGVEDGNIVYSEYTSDAMYREGSQRGAIDPCFPAKVATAHDTLPFDDNLLDRLFGEDVRQGRIVDPLDINDVWKQPFIASTALKLWAAKFTARHPNLIGIEISNFKCGHDAPTYQTVEKIIEQSGSPYFAFRDPDENKPSGSFRVRIETIDYFLKRHREELIRRETVLEEVRSCLAAYEVELRCGHSTSRLFSDS